MSVLKGLNECGTNSGNCHKVVCNLILLLELQLNFHCVCDWANLTMVIILLFFCNPQKTLFIWFRSIFIFFFVQIKFYVQHLTWMFSYFFRNSFIWIESILLMQHTKSPEIFFLFTHRCSNNIRSTYKFIFCIFRHI